MAKAPRPGKTQATKTARRMMSIRIGEHPSVSIAPNNVPMGERLICRKATGFPFEAFWSGEDQVALDSVVVMWWLARRANGEPMLTWTQAQADLPEELEPDDIDLDLDDGTDDDDDEVSAEDADPEG